MKRIVLFSTLFILLGLVPAQTAARARTIKGSGVMRTETREAGRYTGLKVARGVAATIVESDSEKLVVEAQRPHNQRRTCRDRLRGRRLHPLGHQRLRNQGQSGRRPVRDRSAQRSRNKCQGSGRGVQNQRHVGSHLQGPQSADPAHRSARFVGRFGAHHLLRDARSRRFVGRKRLLLGRLPARRFQKEPDRIRHP